MDSKGKVEPTWTVRVIAPHFVAGILVDVGTEKVVEAAPIVKYMLGWDMNKVRWYCLKKGWSEETLTG